MLGLLVGGCGVPSGILMKNPRTDQLFECRCPPDCWLRQGAMEACARALERDGWIRLTP